MLALVAMHVVWWFPPGYLADSGNTFAPSMPIYGSPLLRAYPWNPTQDGGFVNARLSHFLVTLPYYALGDAGLGSWAAQAVWMFAIYWVGSISITLAAREMFPYLRDRFGALLLIGAAYQLAPGLWYKHMNFATYQLPVGFYWGIPLLFFTVLLAERTRSVWVAPAIGAASMLFFSESATGLTLLPLLLPLLVGLFLWRARRHGRLRWSLGYLALAAVWVTVFNLWWALTEYQYRAELLASLATNKTHQTVQPDHIWNLVFFNPLYPTPPPWLPYLGTAWAMAGLGGMFAVCLFALLSVRRRVGLLGVFAAWAASLVLVYGYGAPVGNLYLAAIHASFVLNLFRNAERWAFPLDFLTALLFGVGALALYDAALARVRSPAAAANARPTMGETPGPTRRRRARFGERAVRVGLPVAFAVLLVLAGWPLLTGSFLVNTRDVRALQVYSVPASPARRGVSPPADYAQMGRWIAAQAPYDTSMVFPMPGAWIRDARGSNLSWGFQGTGSIYSGLLPTPLILNDAEPLTNASFPAVSAAYALAQTSGPPGPPVPVIPVGNITVAGTSRGSNDNVSWTPAAGPDGSSGCVWSLGPISARAPTRTHSMLVNVTTLPAGASFLGLWVNSTAPGRLSIGWRNATALAGSGGGAANNSSIPAPRVNTTVAAGNWTFEFFDLGAVPNATYPFPLTGPLAFANSTRLGIHFTVNSSYAGLSQTVRLGGLATYAPDPRGFVYYLESLGADLAVVDRSLETSSAASPQQNLTSYAPLLRSLAPYRAAQFGNLTAYKLPDPPLAVEVGTRWTAVPVASLAWSGRAANGSFFVQGAPPAGLPALPTGGAATLESLRQPNPDTYALSVVASAPFAVVLLQNFDPLWRAYVDNRPLSTHFVANGFANGWWVNRTGPLQIRLVFGPERMYETLVEMSAGAGGVLFLATLAVRRKWLPVRFLRRSPAARPGPSARAPTGPASGSGRSRDPAVTG